MRSPRRFFLRHTKTNEGKIVAGFIESLPPPALDEVRNTELVVQFEAAIGKRAQLIFDGHSLTTPADGCKPHPLDHTI